MPDLVYRPAALTDLDEIYDYIAADHPGRAFSYIQDIQARCRVLQSHPQLGTAREDLGAGIRILPIQRRAVVAYRIAESAILVVRVFYGGRDYAALMREPDAPDPSDKT